MIVGLDPGNFETKVITAAGAFKSLSCLGEYREFNIDKEFGEGDIIYKYKGEKGFAGRLAMKESLFKRQMAGDSKAHPDALIRTLLALHLFTDDLNYKIVVNQPIKKHKKDKSKIVDMMTGKHHIEINGVTKEINIESVSVAPEGAISYWALGKTRYVERIIDVGSGTVNAATIIDGEFIDLESFTLVFGANSEEKYEVKNLVAAIISEATVKRWKKSDVIRVCGGIAEDTVPLLKEYFYEVEVIKPKIRLGNQIKIIHPVYANAMGCYELACELYGE